MASNGEWNYRSLYTRKMTTFVKCASLITSRQTTKICRGFNVKTVRDGCTSDVIPPKLKMTSAFFCHKRVEWEDEICVLFKAGNSCTSDQLTVKWTWTKYVLDNLQTRLVIMLIVPVFAIIYGYCSVCGKITPWTSINIYSCYLYFKCFTALWRSIQGNV